MKRTFCVLVGSVLMILTSARLQAQNDALLSLSTGAFAIVDRENTIEFRVEFRSGEKLGFFTPIFGVQMTSNGAVYTFTGFNYDVFTHGHFAITPSFAAGVYNRGEGKNLGGMIEFRSGIEFSWISAKLARISVAVHHISNAGIYSYNPGAESIVLTFSQPLHL